MRTNGMWKIGNANGNWVSNEKGVAIILTDYYKKSSVLDCVPPKVTEEMNVMLN